MRPEQWQAFKTAAKRQGNGPVPLALIIDSPWIPGYLGIKHLDYYLNPDTWFESNCRVLKQFPEVTFFPSWWMEYGMAIEPSAMGAKIRFWQDKPPSEAQMLFRIEDVEKLTSVDPYTDGFMPLALHRYKMEKPRIFDAGYTIPAVAARGPLCTATFLRGITDFMMDIIEAPERAHQLLKLSTDTVIGWLKAQAETIGPSVQGIFVLDDVVGLLGKKHYQEFAHPYLKRVCDAFPPDWVKVYHNDANIEQCIEFLPDAGFDVLNWGKQTELGWVRERVGNRLTLMGNVNPLEIGVRGTPDQVKSEALRILEAAQGQGIILSMGGGVSPGMPEANITAMIEAAREFNGA